MTIEQLVETIVFSRSCLVIKDDHNIDLAYVNTGDYSEYSKYAEYEVMEVYSVEPFRIIAKIWL